MMLCRFVSADDLRPAIHDMPSTSRSSGTVSRPVMSSILHDGNIVAPSIGNQARRGLCLAALGKRQAAVLSVLSMVSQWQTRRAIASNSIKVVHSRAGPSSLHGRTPTPCVRRSVNGRPRASPSRTRIQTHSHSFPHSRSYATMATAPSQDHYAVLNLGRGATKQQIKAKFYELSKKTHPDAPGGDVDKFHKIGEAYEILSDDSKRSAHFRLG